MKVAVFLADQGIHATRFVGPPPRPKADDESLRFGPCFDAGRERDSLRQSRLEFFQANRKPQLGKPVFCFRVHYHAVIGTDPKQTVVVRPVVKSAQGKAVGHFVG